MPNDSTTDAPRRVQRRRAKGWRQPPDAIYVGRPSKWGNPYRVTDWGPEGDPIELQRPLGQEGAVGMFRDAALGLHVGGPLFTDDDLAELRGRDLVCWCPLTDKRGDPVPCHADVLLELANRCSECHGSGWVRLFGGDGESPGGSAPDPGPGRPGVVPCLACEAVVAL